jgi:hypothetical protein
MGTMDSSDAARALVRQRWGTQVVDRSIAVLQERADEPGPQQLADLRQLLETTDTTERDEMAELIPFTGPTAAEIRAGQVAEIAAAMAAGMNAANARTAEAAAWLAGGLPATELDKPAPGEAGAA